MSAEILTTTRDGRTAANRNDAPKPLIREVSGMTDPPKGPGEPIARVRFLHGETTGTANADKQTRIYLDAVRQCIIFDRWSVATENSGPAKHITRKRYPMASVAFYVLEGEPLGT
jgi:hypothetical protein